ncbi:hypothetical protein B0H14DRAFT_2571903 [Mycena olivaceomarginata]|nr:hypothetical protein B0H14DRAFT_2571903 [Mycena olivaceomarginata]
MLPADLKIIMEYLDSAEAVKYFTETQRLYFKAFVTTAFTLWTRNDELVNLQFKDIKLDLRSRTENPYHEFSLIFRKTNKDPTKVQKYMVQIDTSHPEIDCYTQEESVWQDKQRYPRRRVAARPKRKSFLQTQIRQGLRTEPHFEKRTAGRQISGTEWTRCQAGGGGVGGKMCFDVG